MVLPCSWGWVWSAWGSAAASERLVPKLSEPELKRLKQRELLQSDQEVPEADQEQPGNASAWEDLAKAQLHEAGGEAYVTQAGVVTSKGKELYSQVARSWNSGYLAVNNPNPNPELAQQMVNVFGEEGLNQPAEAVKVLQIVVAADPKLYTSGELATTPTRPTTCPWATWQRKRRCSLAPAAQRPWLKSELAALKKNPSGTETETATSNPGSRSSSNERERIYHSDAHDDRPTTTTGTTTTPVPPYLRRARRNSPGTRVAEFGETPYPPSSSAEARLRRTPPDC